MGWIKFGAFVFFTGVIVALVTTAAGLAAGEMSGPIALLILGVQIAIIGVFLFIWRAAR